MYNLNEKFEVLLKEILDINISEKHLLEEDLEFLNINSLSFIKLLVGLEREFNIEFTGVELIMNYYKNLSDIIIMLNNKVAGDIES